MGLRRSHLVCYTVRMMIKEDIFEVTLARWADGTNTTTHILATDLEHAKRIAWRKWRSGAVEPAKPFPKFDGKKVGEFNR